MIQFYSRKIICLLHLLLTHCRFPCNTLEKYFFEEMVIIAVVKSFILVKKGVLNLVISNNVLYFKLAISRLEICRIIGYIKGQNLIVFKCTLFKHEDI
jgi:hypothetical protein